MPNKKYKVGGLFSGVGGIELGFQKTNKFKIAWSTDVDAYAAKTYRANFKHKFYEEDINNLDGKTLEAVDILVGGFPCQAFSVAGYRKGFEDQRGNVFFQIIRIINELPRKPKVLLLENVKNIFITGINGFIGGNLAKILYSYGANIFGLIRDNKKDTFIRGPRCGF